MSLSHKVIDVSGKLVTVDFTDSESGGKITRNYVKGDHEMIRTMLKTTQSYFLSKQFGRQAENEYRRRRGDFEADAESVAQALIAKEAAE